MRVLGYIVFVICFLLTGDGYTENHRKMPKVTQNVKTTCFDVYSIGKAFSGKVNAMNNEDSLGNTIQGNTSFTEDYQTFEEAIRLYPVYPCTLKTLLYLFGNSEAETRQKECEFYIYEDNNGVPGDSYEKYWRGTITIAGNARGYISVDVSSQQIVFDKPFWISHVELTSGNPTSLIDTVGTDYTNFYRGSSGWNQDDYNYEQFALVNYEYDTFTSLSAAVDSGQAESDYRMISVPGVLDENSPSVLENTLGAYDSTAWRFFQYKNGFHEYPNTDALEPGKAFWIISKKDTILQFGSGTHLFTVFDHSVPVVTGWNQIGNPYKQPVNWNDIKSANPDASIQGPYFYGNSGYDIVKQEMDAFEGCFVYVENINNLIIPGPATLSKSNKLLFEKADWLVQITAGCGHAVDQINYLGSVSRAELANEYNYFEPPVIGDYVSLAFQDNPAFRTGHSYTTDFRTDCRDGGLWTFELNSLSRNQPIKLSFNGLSELPENWDVMLQDETAGRTVDVKAADEYSFINQDGTARKFNLFVGDQSRVGELSFAEQTPEAVRLLQNYPNPFNPVTTIEYDLTENTQVTVSVYNINGRLVQELLNQSQDAGRHRLTWDAQPFSTGVYFIKLTTPQTTLVQKMLYIQ